MSVDEHTERLRAVLQGNDGGPFDPDVADVRARADRLATARRRRRVGASLAAVAASAAALVGVAILIDDDQAPDTGTDEVIVADDPGAEDPGAEDPGADDPGADEQVEPEPPAEPEPAPDTEPGPDNEAGASPWPAGDPLPAELFVAIAAEPGVEEGLHRVVLVDRSTGEILADGAPGVGDSEGGILDVALSPDRRTIYYAVSTSACDAEIRVVGASGPAEPVVLGPGADVAVSADGTRLAVTVDQDCDGHDQLRVIDLVASRPGDLVFDEWDELVPDGEADGLIIWLDHLTWTGPDELLYQVTLEDGLLVQRHDLTDPSLVTAGGVIVSTVDPLARGLMAPGGSAPWVANQCLGHQEASCPVELVAFDPTTGEAVGAPIPSPTIVTNISGSQPVWTTASGELFVWQGTEAVRLEPPAGLTWLDLAD